MSIVQVNEWRQEGMHTREDIPRAPTCPNHYLILVNWRVLWLNLPFEGWEGQSFTTRKALATQVHLEHQFLQWDNGSNVKSTYLWKRKLFLERERREYFWRLGNSAQDRFGRSTRLETRRAILGHKGRGERRDCGSLSRGIRGDENWLST